MPRNSNFAIAQAATTPNTRLRPTEIAAVTSVSLIADSASGSDSAAKIGADAPCEKACGEHHDQRQHDEDGQERHRDADDEPAHQPRLGPQVALRQRRDAGVTVGSAMLAPVVVRGVEVTAMVMRQLTASARVCAQRCRRLTTKMIRNDATSMTTAIAVASA